MRSLYFICVHTIRPLDIWKHYEFFQSLNTRSSRLIRISSPHLRLVFKVVCSVKVGRLRIVRYFTLRYYRNIRLEKLMQIQKSLTSISRRYKNCIPSKCELEASTLFPPAPWKLLHLLFHPVQSSVHFMITVFRHVTLRTLLLLHFIPSNLGNVFFQTSVPFYQNIHRQLSEQGCLHSHGPEIYCCSF